jgi:hypothetical protein
MPWGNKKAGRYLLTRRVCLGVLPMPPMRCIGWHRSNQAEGKRLSPCPGNCLRPAVNAELAGKLNPTCAATVLTLELVLLPECDYVR